MSILSWNQIVKHVRDAHMIPWEVPTVRYVNQIWLQHMAKVTNDETSKFGTV